MVACTATSHAQTPLTLDAKELKSYILGKAYQGINPETQNVVASVVYHADGTSTLWLATDGSAETKDEPGSYRLHGNTYRTRYLNFRENSENCFRLTDIGDGRAQAHYTDGRTALILAPIEIPERLR